MADRELASFPAVNCAVLPSRHSNHEGSSTSLWSSSRRPHESLILLYRALCGMYTRLEPQGVVVLGTTCHSWELCGIIGLRAPPATTWITSRKHDRLLRSPFGPESSQAPVAVADLEAALRALWRFLLYLCAVIKEFLIHFELQSRLSCWVPWGDGATHHKLAHRHRGRHKLRVLRQHVSYPVTLPPSSTIHRAGWRCAVEQTGWHYQLG